jgi:hypothetical protein
MGKAAEAEIGNKVTSQPSKGAASTEQKLTIQPPKAGQVMDPGADLL